MSYPYLPPGLVPAKENSWLNPIASVWIKSSFINILAVAPLVPLIRGWYVAIAKSTVSLPSHTRRYYTAFDAAWHTGKGIHAFRGSLPLLGSIPIVTGFSILTMLHASMFAQNNEDYTSLAIACGSLVAQEIVVSPLRSLHTTVATWSFLHHSKQEKKPYISLRSTFMPLRYFLPASVLVASYPLLFPYSPNRTPDLVEIPLFAVFGLGLYTLYERGFRDILMQNRNIREGHFTGSFTRQPPPIGTRLLTFVGGMVSLFVIKASTAMLAVHLANKHHKSPV